MAFEEVGFKIPHPEAIDAADITFLENNFEIVKWFHDLNALGDGDEANELVWRPLSQAEWFSLVKAKEQVARIREESGFNYTTPYIPGLIEAIWDYALQWHKEWDARFISSRLFQFSTDLHRVVQLQRDLDQVLEGASLS